MWKSVQVCQAQRWRSRKISWVINQRDPWCRSQYEGAQGREEMLHNSTTCLVFYGILWYYLCFRVFCGIYGIICISLWFFSAFGGILWYFRLFCDMLWYYFILFVIFYDICDIEYFVVFSGIIYGIFWYHLWYSVVFSGIIYVIVWHFCGILFYLS